MNDWLKTTSVTHAVRDSQSPCEAPEFLLRERDKRSFSKFPKKEFKKETREKKETRVEEKSQKKRNSEGTSIFMAPLAFSEKTMSADQGIAGVTMSAHVVKNSLEHIGILIQKMVEEMRIGQIEGKDVASLDLKATSDVPSFFQGAHLTITQVQKGTIAIDFTNLTQDNMKQALIVMEHRKAELEQLVHNLHNKNISISVLRLGDYAVELPHIDNFAFISSTDERATERDKGDSQQRGEQDNDE